MSTYARRQNPKMTGQARSRRGVPIRQEDSDVLPFPNKPVFHRRPSRTRARLHPSDFEKLAVSSRPGAPLRPREPHPTGSGGSAGSGRSGADSHGSPGGGPRPGAAIVTKQLLLQEKLLKAAEKIGRKIQRESRDAAADGGPGRGAGGHGGIPERRGRQAGESGDRLREDVREPRQKPDRRTDGAKNACDGDPQRAGREVGAPRSRAPQLRSAREKQGEAYGEQNKVRWQNASEHARRKDERRGGDIWEKTSGKGCDKACDSSQASEQKYRDGTQAAQDRSGGQELRQRGQQRAAGGNPRGTSNPAPVPGAAGCSGLRQEEQEQGQGQGQGQARAGGPPSGSLRTLPCKICHRKFAEDRLGKHVSICRKANQTRPVYNSYAHRTKGSTAEEFYRTHERSQTPEIIKKKHQRRKNMRNTSNQQQIGLPAGLSQPKPFKTV